VTTSAHDDAYVSSARVLLAQGIILDLIIANRVFERVSPYAARLASIGYGGKHDFTAPRERLERAPS
jgi:hypothetical protein